MAKFVVPALVFLVYGLKLISIQNATLVPLTSNKTDESRLDDQYSIHVTCATSPQQFILNQLTG
jgi:hypothetical protein